ncbi:60S acidic ribosomal protein P1-like [Alexandromys fortis]|uniref:60S acidic ribosomal protein P1-like n=1 Tax=Alexandromys fortis TaxID=100897 RepID=UPI0021535558|nr:60S acidic ribosomal protein P1-like [Microtus fortis]
MPAVRNIVSISEPTCVHSTRLLYNHEVTAMEDNINVLIKAAGTNVEPFWSGLFTDQYQHWSLICNVGAGGPAPAAGASAAGPALSIAAAPAEEKEGEAEKEESEEADDNMGFGLFD